MKVEQTASHPAGSAALEPVRFRPRRLGHANLFVGDVERSARFYHMNTPAKRSLFVRDPDGILIEFTHRRSAPASSALPQDVRLV